MKKIAPYQIFILLLTVLLIVGSIYWANYDINRSEIKSVNNISNEAFGKAHYNMIIVDTFVSLLQKSYGQHINVIQGDKQLQVGLSFAGAITADFYNGNDNLLKLDKDAFGFEISRDKTSNTIEATFVISNGAVPVPNDVMIQLLNKSYNR